MTRLLLAIALIPLSGHGQTPPKGHLEVDKHGCRWEGSLNNTYAATYAKAKAMGLCSDLETERVRLAPILSSVQCDMHPNETCYVIVIEGQTFYAMPLIGHPQIGWRHHKHHAKEK